MRPPRTLAVCAATGVGTMLIAIAGCTGDGSNAAPPEPTATTTPTPSASQSPSPTVAPPEMPAKAKANTDAGAEAFVRYYVKLVNHAAATGEVDRLRSISKPCGACQKLADMFADTYAAGGHFEPREIWLLEDVAAIPGQQVVLAALREPRVALISSPGASPDVTKGGPFHMEFRLEHHAGRWTVRNVVRT